MIPIAVLEYGMGNLRSVAKAIEHVGATPCLTSNPARIREAAGVVLPGVGAMPAAMKQVRRLKLDSTLRAAVEQGTPLLGLCMGMQLLFDSTTELGGDEGIGLFRGEVSRLDAPGLKLPQIGWNPVSWVRAHEVNRGLPNPCAFYHVHSFAPRPKQPEDILGTAEYGSVFASVVSRTDLGSPVLGIQSHPEKSGPQGLSFLANFVGICSESKR